MKTKNKNDAYLGNEVISKQSFRNISLVKVAQLAQKYFEWYLTLVATTFSHTVILFPHDHA